MTEKHENIEDEISDLKQELEHFQQEKERVRAIIGKIGGVPKFQTYFCCYHCYLGGRFAYRRRAAASVDD